ncbi:Cytochrome c biogenesis protein [Halanaeroarchaeum sp. HSR-CO]|uniref:cytochrome c biogenesis CcdA family protein n=1 Tax=Halanaeroarchaeum sp. HSR-CO TaxID=2866382 RepID=UPI00217D3D71|nr:cytochrome c biogenesis protein CcdA [Halanaeroarchaeum sp. HSR-CO]UWG49098.1 Cytochrome c biogenesis protein [Halanaeroarchaeum sp. HSR-CO]
MIGGASSTLSAFSAGLATFFAPCAFPLLPGYVGYYTRTVDEETPLAGAALRGLAGSVGVLFAFGGIAALVFALGRSIVRAVYALEPLVGLALVGIGVLLLVNRFPTLHVQLPERRTSVAGFALFGTGYAVSATSCFAPLFFAVVLGAATSPVGTVTATAAFGLGLAIPLFVATILVGIGHDIGAGSIPAYANRVEQLAGIVIVAAGLWQLTTTVHLWL